MPVRLLHLSDIHFGGYGTIWDEDDDQRDEVLSDVQGLVAQGGAIDGILVGGDVAFSGRPEQFDKARAWLISLVKICGCAQGNVWIVPGNHDVERTRITNSAILQDFRRALRACPIQTVDDMLRERLAKDPCCEVLLSPFNAYNEFALPWGCGVSAHQFHWRDETLRLGERPILLWGMNSVLVSDGDDRGHDPNSDAQANLLLGVRQCRLPRAPNTIRIALSHHPPNWLRDWVRARPYLNRAHLVLLGHEHRQHASQVDPEGTIYIHAGAVGPEQGCNWSPSFNLLTLNTTGEKLTVELEPRVWIADPPRFDLHEEGTRSFTVMLDDQPGASRERETDPQTDDNPAPADATPLGRPTEEEQPTAAEAASRRELVFRYLSAPVTERERIARKLGVFENHENDVPDAEFYAAILRRVRDNDLIDELAKELDA